MKNKNTTIPATSKLNLLRQIGNFIPDFLVPRLARETGVQDKTRTFSPWSHLLALMSAQLTHSIGLNDVCDALALHSGPQILRGLAPQAELLEAAMARSGCARNCWWSGLACW